MKSRMQSSFRSILPALTAVVVTALLAASFVESTLTARSLGNSAHMLPATAA